MRLKVRSRTLKTRQKRMMDIDNPPTHLLAKPRAQDLHVPRQHDQLNPLPRHQLQNPLLLLRLRLRRDGQVVERNPVTRSQRRKVRMVRDDQRDVNLQLVRRRPEEQVVQTVADLRDHDAHPRPFLHPEELVLHPHPLRRFFKRFL